MTFVVVFIVIIFLMLIIARKEKISDGLKTSKVVVPFYKAGSLIFRTFIKPGNEYYKKHYENNALLYPGENAKVKTRDFFVKKIGLCILLVFTGLCMYLLIQVSNKTSGDSGGYKAKRNSPTGSSYEIKLDANADGENYEDIRIVVDEEKYSYDEFVELMPSFCEMIDEKILEENESLDKVNSDLNLINKISDYPFKIEWQTDTSSVLNAEGKIWQGDVTNEADEESTNAQNSGTIVMLTATITYESYEYVYEFAAVVYPKELTTRDIVRQKIAEAVVSSNLATKEETYFTLPETIEGIKVVWTKKTTDNSWILLILVFVGAIGIFVGQDKDVSKKMEQRDSEMIQDYSEIVSKLAMLIGAGMTVRAAFKKVANEGKGKRYAYEEMKFTVNEMESGNLESVCYKHFCQRVKLQKYVKLVSLLEQNTRMGSKGLIVDLKKESKDAFEDKKNFAERKGEEAGTKLMIPMFMQLLIVMVVIMVPAFMGM